MTDQPLKPEQNFPVTVNAQYIKDFSFENPNAPQIFTPSQNAPQLTMNVNVQSRNVAPNSFEVALTLKIESTVEGKTAFISELVYAGVFTLPEMPEEHLKLFLLVEAPRILFPYARAALTNTIRDGGYPYVMIQPVDFMALYLANQGNISTMPTVGAA
jgi:preprotein translocase subunit SecB